MIRLQYTLLFGFIHAISLLPLRVLYLISGFIYLVVFYLIGYRKKMVLKNISLSFPENSEREHRMIRKKFYQHFADLIIESIKSATMSSKEFQKRYYIINQELIENYYKEGKSMIILSPHTGNWEWIFSIVDVIPYHVYAVYQRLSNPQMDEYIRATRQRFGACMIPTKKIFSTVAESAQNGEQFLTWMAADQACKPEKALWVNFLNRETTFHKGFESLARQVNHPVFFLDIKKVKRSYYELELILITDQPQSMPEGAIVKEFAKLTEKRIKKQPAYWLWTHNRWKHKKAF